MKEIRGKNYPNDFVNYMISIYGTEALMPEDRIIFIWSHIFEAGRAIGYKQARENCW